MACLPSLSLIDPYCILLYTGQQFALSLSSPTITYSPEYTFDSRASASLPPIVFKRSDLPLIISKQLAHCFQSHLASTPFSRLVYREIYKDGLGLGAVLKGTFYRSELLP